MANEAERQRSRPDGLDGQWVPVEELLALDLFQSKKRPFKIKLNANFAPRPDEAEPGIKAAVRREYEAGDVICRAGDYGSTAFLLLEGSATARVPARAEPRPIHGRTARSVAWLAGLFGRRSGGAGADEAGALEAGEVSRYATMSAERPPADRALGPGDLFGVDACVNFYPREATVEATGRCVVVEMLRSVLDTIRDAGTAGPAVEEAYAAEAVRLQLRLSPLFRDLDDGVLESIAAGAELVDPDSERVRDGVLYRENDEADAFFLVRAGTVKLSQVRGGSERVLSYLGRGTAFGFEGLVGNRAKAPLLLRCTSHAGEFPDTVLEGNVTLGRTGACDVRFPRENTAIGRRHCRFEEQDGDVALVDLESANFTLHNGERIQSTRVRAGDRVTVVEYEFEIVEQAAAPAGAGEEEAPRRRADAAGLDSFELVLLGAKAVREALAAAGASSDALDSVARSLEAAVSRETAERREVVRELVDLNLYNSQNTLLIDLDRCTRCDECVRACADAHDGTARFTRDGPRVGHYMVTMACRSCTDPKCMIGCPVGSIRRRESLEVHIEDWCIGCERCANQCPFGVINMVERPAPAAADAAAAPAALKASSCDLCAGHESPNCVYACPHDAAIRVQPAEFLPTAVVR